MRQLRHRQVKRTVKAKPEFDNRLSYRSQHIANNYTAMLLSEQHGWLENAGGNKSEVKALCFW